MSMVFCLFMLAMDLLIPRVMIACGAAFRSRVPRRINALVGYRTTMSMKNMDTWRFAHERCGGNLTRMGSGERNGSELCRPWSTNTDKASGGPLCFMRRENIWKKM